MAWKNVELQNKWREKNKDKLREYQRKYQLKHRERINKQKSISQKLRRKKKRTYYKQPIVTVRKIEKPSRPIQPQTEKQMESSRKSWAIRRLKSLVDLGVIDIE